MIRVIIESPFRGDGSSKDTNVLYLRACMRDCLKRGEAPFASHGLYTQPGVLDDDDAEEHSLGIDAGFAWREAAQKTVVYTDLGTSLGMVHGILHAESIPGHEVEHRQLGDDWETDAENSEAMRPGAGWY